MSSAVFNYPRWTGVVILGDKCYYLKEKVLSSASFNYSRWLGVVILGERCSKWKVLSLLILVKSIIILGEKYNCLR